MVEWGVTPDYIVSNWTDELFMLMVDCLVARKEREAETIGSGDRKVSHKDMFGMIGAKVGN